MELTDGSLVLRPPEERDAEAIGAACADPEISRWLPLLPQPYTVERAREFVAWAGDQNAAGHQQLVIVDASGGGLLGSIGLKVEARMGYGLIGYWVAADARGRGVATAALRLLAGWALGEGGLGRVELYTDPDNLASQRVAEKAGFSREGVLRSHSPQRDGSRRDSVLFSLLPGELA